MWRIKIVFLITFFLPAGFVGAAEKILEKLSRGQAIQIALNHNPEINEIRGGVTYAEGVVAEAYTGYWPKLKLNVGYGYGQMPKMSVSDDLVKMFAKSAGLTSASEIINQADGLAVLALMAGPDGQAGTADDISETAAWQMLTSSDPAINPLRHKGEGGIPLTINQNGLATHISDHHANPITWKGDEYYFDYGTTKRYPFSSYSWEQIYATSYSQAKELATLSSMGEQFFATQASLVQPIYTFGKIPGYQRAAEMQLAIARQDVVKKVSEIIFTVTQRYLESLLAKEGSLIAEDAVGQLKAMRDITASLLQGGSTRVTSADLLKNEVYLHQAQIKLIEAQQGMKLALSALNFTLGRSPDETIVLADEGLNYAVQELNRDQLQADMFQFRPEWQQVAMGIEALEAKVQIARSDYYPMLGISGECQYISDIPDYYRQANPQPTYRIAIGLTYELFDLFKTPSAKVKQAEGELNKLKAKQVWAKQGLAMELKKQYLAVEEMQAKIQESQEAVKSATQYYRLCFDGYRIGAKDFSDVVEAQILEAEMKFFYKKNIFDYLLALAELEKVVGHEAVIYLGEK